MGAEQKQEVKTAVKPGLTDGRTGVAVEQFLHITVHETSDDQSGAVSTSPVWMWFISSFTGTA